MTFTTTVQDLGDWGYLGAFIIALIAFFGVGFFVEWSHKRRGETVTQGSALALLCIVVGICTFLGLSIAWKVCKHIAGPSPVEVAEQQSLEARWAQQDAIAGAAKVRDLQAADACVKETLLRTVKPDVLISAAALKKASADCEIKQSTDPKQLLLDQRAALKL